MRLKNPFLSSWFERALEWMLFGCMVVMGLLVIFVLILVAFDRFF